MMEWKVVLILLFILFTSSCEFEPTGKYVAPVTEPTEVPPLDIDLNITIDTIYMYWPISINFHVDAGTAKIADVLYYIDNVPLEASFENNTYTIRLKFNESGTHSFKISIITKTGSGSMADILGMEGFEYTSKTWTLIYDPVEVSKNMTYIYEDEGLRFSWKRCNYFGFKKYRLYERSTGYGYILTDTSFLNTNYVGQESDYDLFAVDNENNSYWWGSCSVTRNLPVLKFTEINKQLALIWNSTRYSQNIAEYQVWVDDGPAWRLLSSLPNSDTMLILNTDDILYGKLVQFSLFCVPEKYGTIENSSLFKSFSGSYTFALDGPDFSNNTGLSCSGFFFHDYSSALSMIMLFRHSALTETTDALMEYNLYCDISANQVLLLSPVSGILDLYELETMNKIRSVNIKSYVPGFYNALYPKISDNGICIFSYTDTLYAFDVLNNEMITKKRIPGGQLKISPDGSLFMVNRSDSFLVYRINSGSIELQASEKKSSPVNSYVQFDFCPSQPENLYSREGSTLYIKSCTDLSTIRNFSFNGTFFNIDFCSGKVLVARELYGWDIYNFYTGDIVQTINTAVSAGAANYTLLTNNTIYYSGHRYYLND